MRTSRATNQIHRNKSDNNISAEESSGSSSSDGESDEMIIIGKNSNGRNVRMEGGLKPFDDERFSLTDCIKRREIYRPLSGKSQKDPKSVICINLTKNHFQSPDASSFDDLKPDTRIIVDSIFNALGFATDKKPRLSQSPTEKKNTRANQQKENRRKKGVPSSSEKEEEERLEADENGNKKDGMDIEEGKEKKFLNGNEHLTVIIETLTESFSKNHNDHMKIAGFRIWIQDSSNEAKEMDIVTKGLKESFIESTQMNGDIIHALAQHEKTLSRSKKSQQNALVIAPKFHFTSVRNDSLFINKVGDYFTSDDYHSTSVITTSKGGESYFIDDRKFLISHGDNEKFGPKSNTLSSLFTKELAMFSHVEQANICLEQRCLESYYGSDIDDIADAIQTVFNQSKNPQRLKNLVRDKIDDSEFQQFPYPSITYQIPLDRLSHDLFTEMPLPHRIGSFLYNEMDYDTLEKGTSENNFFLDNEEEENDEEREQKRKTPLGLHDTEEEITVEHFQEFPNQLSSVIKNTLKNGSSISNIQPSEFDTFKRRVTTKVHQELITLNDNIRKKKDCLVLKSVLNAPRSKVANNSCDKKHVLFRRIARIKGLTDEDELNERRKMLSTADTAYYSQFLGKYRPIEPTIENVYKCIRTPRFEEQFMENDIFLVTNCLNEYGFQKIDEEFFDPETGEVREGEMGRYLKTRRIFMEAITVEYWREFFQSNRVSMPHMGVRSDLMGKVRETKRIGLKLPVTKFNMKARHFHIFKHWVYGYFVQYSGINHHFKIMDSLYFSKFHHCRCYSPNAKNPKLNFLIYGQGMGGKSHRLDTVRQSCPTGVAESATHMTDMIYNVDQNMDDFCIFNEEISNKLVAPSGGRGGANGTSEAANDNVRNNFKERATGISTTTWSFFYDDETKKRQTKISRCQCQCVYLAATNNDLTYTDPNVMSRFNAASVPRSKNEVIGNRPQDKNPHQIGVDKKKMEDLVEEHREVHRVYFMIEKMIKSGILGDSEYGVSIDSAQTLITEILDTLESKYGVKTDNVRKRNNVLEMARCKCIAFAVWYGLTSPLTRHLQSDPITGEFIGFNPRVLIDGILPYLVITKDMVIDALTTLSYLWGHDYIEPILKHVSTTICKLDELREEDFCEVKKSTTEGGVNKSTVLLNNGADSRSKKKSKIIGLNDMDEDDITRDYNYISISSRNQREIHSYISDNISGDLSIAPDDISKVLHELANTRIETDGYIMGVGKNDKPRLIRSKNKNDRIKRKIVDYGKDVHGNATVIISVAYLKQKLPHILHDGIIQDLTRFSPIDESINNTNKTIDLNQGEEDNDDESDEMNIENEGRGNSRYDEKKREMLDALIIKEGANNETCLVKAIRYVLENSVLEFDPLNEEQEIANMEDYIDPDTNTVPWLNYVTSEYPSALMVDQLYPDLFDNYSKLPKYNKEILLVDEIAVLQLKRKQEGPPLIIYNYNTVSPITKSCLSVYSFEKEPETPLTNDPTNAVLRVHEAEMEAMRQSAQKRGDLTKKRFKLYTENATMFVDRDLDRIACEQHLLHIGYNEPDPNGRLCNYPPHAYMNMVDYNSQYFPERDDVPIYANIIDKVATTRNIIESRLSLGNPKNGKAFSEMIYANYNQNDVRLQRALLHRSNHGGGIIRRDPSIIARDKKKTENNTLKRFIEYGMKDIGKLHSNIPQSNGISPNKKKNRKNVKSLGKEKK